MNTHQHSNEVLYLAIETSQKTWGLTFSNGRRKRMVEIESWNRHQLNRELDKALKKYGLSQECIFRSCYEAGRDGFSIHRFLDKEFAIENIVVDPASIEVNRRKRRRKTDRLDGKSLVRMLYRYYELEEHDIWSVCRIPAVGSEDERRPGREMERLKKEKTQHTNRIKSLLATIGISKINRVYDCKIEYLVPEEYPSLLAELQREQKRLALVREQIKEIAKERYERLKKPQTHADEVAAKLHRLKSIGPVSSWDLSKEFFGWRTFDNRKQVGALAGLTGTPYDSGGSTREQGISKAGRSSIRKLAVEIAWLWLRYQPDSKLSKWFHERFDPKDQNQLGTNKRNRRKGIVALARKLLIALWKYIKFDEIPEGAVLKS